MDLFLAVLLCSGIFVGYNSQPVGNLNFACRDGEEYDSCRSPCEPTCDSIISGISKNCSRPCIAGCFCTNGLLRASDNTCVTPKECSRPMCKENEEYNECGSPCIMNCTNRNDPIFCTKPCYSGCFCKSGFVQDTRSRCVHPRNCPIEGNRQCPINERYVNCVNFCNTCWELNYCNSPYCRPGCECNPGYYRNFYGDCVTEEQCYDSIYGLQKSCGENEEYTSCVNPCNDCLSRGSCAYPSYYCEPGCDCKKGYLRNDRGLCVLEQNCYRGNCRENEVYLECGPTCRNTCENYRGLLYNPCRGDCIPGCFCRDNLVLASDGRCVLPEYCPKERPDCPINEQYYVCIPTCQNTCETYNDTSAVCDTNCIKGCFCKGGFVRRRDGVCVLPRDCPGSQNQKCPPGESFYDCIPCQNTCEDLNSTRPCLLSCRPGCACPKGFFKRQDGICVRRENCPIVCGENEEFRTCGSPCVPTCSNFSDGRVCGERCVRGCFCVVGFVRGPNGTCIRPNNCPTIPSTSRCPVGETFYNCTPCRSTCDDLNSTRPCIKICRPGCACQSGFFRRQDGLCVEPKNCPIVCGVNEDFLTCGSLCFPTCANTTQQPGCSRRCIKGCFCRRGFVRGPSGMCIRPRDCPAIPRPCSTPGSANIAGRRGGPDDEISTISTTPDIDPIKTETEPQTAKPLITTEESQNNGTNPVVSDSTDSATTPEVTASNSTDVENNTIPSTDLPTTTMPSNENSITGVTTSPETVNNITGVTTSPETVNNITGVTTSAETVNTSKETTEITTKDAETTKMATVTNSENTTSIDLTTT